MVQLTQTVQVTLPYSGQQVLNFLQDPSHIALIEPHVDSLSQFLQEQGKRYALGRGQCMHLPWHGKFEVKLTKHGVFFTMIEGPMSEQYHCGFIITQRSRSQTLVTHYTELTLTSWKTLLQWPIKHHLAKIMQEKMTRLQNIIGKHIALSSAA